MKRKIKIQFCIIGAIAIISTAILMILIFNEMFKKEIMSELELATDIIKISDMSKRQEKEKEWEELKKIRITLIRSDGTVIFDNYANEDTMVNHKSRPEVLDAIKKGSGKVIRYSTTMGKNTYYYTNLLENGLVLRVAKEINSIWSIMVEAIPGVIICSIILFLFCILLANLLTKRIVKPIEMMVGRVENDTSGVIVYDELLPFVRTIQKQHNDILEQMNSLKQETAKIQMISEKMEEGLLLLDHNKNLMIANPSAMRLLNSKTLNYQGKQMIYFSRNEILDQCINLALSGKKADKELAIEDRKLQIFANPVLDEEGEVIGAMCFILDITENIRNEKLRRDFTANVSHELKTPLTAISGYAELIEQGMVPQEGIRDFAIKIHKSANRLLGLINDIIKLSQLDGATETTNFVSFDLWEVVKECVGILEDHARKNSVIIEMIGESNDIYGSKEMIEELLYNLCGNAIQYNKPNGKVLVSVKKENSKVVLSVEDTGIGIPEKYQQRVFERFFRVDRSRSKATGGTGLGLAIVKHIVEYHKAKLSIKSKQGEGTCIQVYFTIYDKKI